ncbi:galactokinase [Emticicia sp. BO119]|uniref:galactokinase n=1 Tax=Emticicia sp. BO119 TaxID=2757768 RepID=UPI0015F00AF7|nr:galactokinase [Emticicia sp. BO119]MBA4848782.1 galactokinase [Emticicia sp. BO119]
MYPENIKQKFSEIFNQNPDIIVRAPGRINLIGEHTDYNDGFVLPAAIDKAIYFAVSKRNDKAIKLFAFDLDDSYEFSLDNLTRSDKGWANFLIGMVAEMTRNSDKLTNGFNAVFGGDVPLGAGLSSSAAVESGIGFTLNQLYGFELSGINLALTAQQAEHNFAGVKCGIMDMFASIHGKTKSVIKLDCRDLSYEYFPFNTTEYTIVLCNSGVKHNLGDSEYNKRRAECEEGISILQEAFPQVNSLRDATIPMLRAQSDKLPQVVFNRCRYVVEEINRVELACKDLLDDDFIAFGQKMYETHEGLSDLYEVSCPELDFLVEQTINNEAVAGARMMGGGFGGCTINLVKKESVHDFLAEIGKAYETKFNQKLESYKVAITNGVEEITE